MDEITIKYGHEIEVEPEYTIVGNTHKGKVDVAVTLDKAIVLVTEIKKEDLNLGMAQNFLQILAARQQNIRRKVNMGDTMYGLVSTGFESILVRVVFKMNGRFTLTRSRIIKLPTGKTSASEQVLSERVESLSGKTMWAVDNQANILRGMP
jgi:hypothetical protein